MSFSSWNIAFSCLVMSHFTCLSHMLLTQENVFNEQINPGSQPWADESDQKHAGAESKEERKDCKICAGSIFL